MRQWLLQLTIILLNVSVENASSQQNYIQFRQLSTEQGLSSPVVYDIIQDRDGFIWIATNNGLNRYDGYRFVVFLPKKNDDHSLIHSTVKSLCVDTADQVWAGTNSGVSRFNKNTNSFHRYVLQPIQSNEELTNRISEIYCDHLGTIWAATEQGLFRYDANTDQFRGFLPDLPSSSGNKNFFFANSLIHDTINRGLWCSVNYELCFFDFESEAFFHHQNNPKRWSIFSKLHGTAAQTRTREGYLIFNDHDHETLIIYDLENHAIIKEIYSGKKGFDILANTFLSAFADPLNRVWMGNWSGRPVIIDWENESVDISLYAEDYPGMMMSRDLNNGFVSNDGTWWLCTSNGIFLHDPKKQLYESHWLKEGDRFTREWINYILPDRDQKLWIATNSYLIHYDLMTREEEWILLNLDGHHWDINCLAHRNDDEIWVGTVWGLLIYDKGRKKFFHPGCPPRIKQRMWQKSPIYI